MRYSEEIEQKLVEQIRREPERPVILADRHYWAGQNQPTIYVDDMPTPLIRHLYSVLIEDLPEDVGLANPVDIDPRNVNPHLAVRLPTRRSRPACPNGHPYDDDDFVPGVGHRCRECYEMRLLGTPQLAEVNREKTECPRGHPYSPENTMKTKQGKRKCRTCARIHTAAWRARKEAS